MEITKILLQFGIKKRSLNKTDKPKISRSVNMAAVIILIKLSEAHGMMTNTHELNRSVLELSIDDECSPCPLDLRMKNGKIFLKSADQNSMDSMPHRFSLTHLNITKNRLDSLHIKPYLVYYSCTSENEKTNFKMPTATIVNIPFKKLSKSFNEPTSNITHCFEIPHSKKYFFDFTEFLEGNNLKFSMADSFNPIYATYGRIAKKIKSRLSQPIDILGSKGCSNVILCNVNKLIFNRETIEKQKWAYFRRRKSTTKRINQLIKNKFNEMIHFSKKNRKRTYDTLTELNIKTLKNKQEFSPIKVNKLENKSKNRNLNESSRLYVNNNLQNNIIVKNQISELLLPKYNLSISTCTYKHTPKQIEVFKQTPYKGVRKRVKREKIYENPVPISIGNKYVISTAVTLTRKILHNKKGENCRALMSFRRTKYESLDCRNRIASNPYFKSKLREKLPRKKLEMFLNPSKKRKNYAISGRAFQKFSRDYKAVYNRTGQVSSRKRVALNFNLMNNFGNLIHSQTRRYLKEFHLTSNIYRERMPIKTKYKKGFTITKSNVKIIHQSVKYSNKIALRRYHSEFFTTSKLDVNLIFVTNENEKLTSITNKIETYENKSIKEEDILRNHSIIYFKPIRITSTNPNIKLSRINNRRSVVFKYKKTNIVGSTGRSRALDETCNTSPKVFKNNSFEVLTRKTCAFNLTNGLFDLTRLNKKENNLSRYNRIDKNISVSNFSEFIKINRGNNETLYYPLDNLSVIAPFGIDQQEEAANQRMKLNYQIYVYRTIQPSMDDEPEEQRRNENREKRSNFDSEKRRMTINSYKKYYTKRCGRYRNITNRFSDQNNINNVIIVNYQSTANTTPFCPCLNKSTTSNTSTTTTTSTTTLPPNAIKIIKEQRFYETKIAFVIIVLFLATILICSFTSCCTMCTYKLLRKYKDKVDLMNDGSCDFQIRPCEEYNETPVC